MCKIIIRKLFGKESLLRRVLRPFRIISMHRAAFFVWFLLTLVGGLVGVIANIVKHVGFGNDVLKDAIFIETANGSLYTYSIAIVASVLSSLFVLFAEKKELNYRFLQIPMAVISIFVLLFGGIFYAFNMDTHNSLAYDWKQISILVLSVLIAVYVFCLSRLDDHNPDFKDISDMQTKNRSIKIPDDLTNENRPTNNKMED